MCGLYSAGRIYNRSKKHAELPLVSDVFGTNFGPLIYTFNNLKLAFLEINFQGTLCNLFNNELRLCQNLNSWTKCERSSLKLYSILCIVFIFKAFITTVLSSLSKRRDWSIEHGGGKRKPNPLIETEKIWSVAITSTDLWTVLFIVNH